MLDYLLERSLIPKLLYRASIYFQLRSRLKNEKKLFNHSSGQNKLDFINQLKSSKIALCTDEENEQHYEVPTDFYKKILGPHLKYSCCYYQNDCDLQQAEINMLELYCERLKLQDGLRILDLGCGWGSFSLYVAKKFPNCSITAVSNSATQKAYIDEQGYENINVITCDINQLQLDEQYDRIISIEMFEHIRNYEALLSRITSWLVDDGYLFVHHFCHKYLIYPFNAEDSWMARNFFKDGIMPSEDLLLYFTNNFVVQGKWRINGSHYKNTCYDWLRNLYKNKQAIISIFENHYTSPNLHYQYWDLFIRACAQLFAYHKGREWFVVHYVFKKINKSIPRIENTF